MPKLLPSRNITYIYITLIHLYAVGTYSQHVIHNIQTIYHIRMIGGTHNDAHRHTRLVFNDSVIKYFFMSLRNLWFTCGMTMVDYDIVHTLKTFSYTKSYILYINAFNIELKKVWLRMSETRPPQVVSVR